MKIIGSHITIDELSVGDYVEVEYRTGGSIKGKITKLWLDPSRQGQVNNDWCFHNGDELLVHKKVETRCPICGEISGSCDCKDEKLVVVNKDFNGKPVYEDVSEDE